MNKHQSIYTSKTLTKKKRKNVAKKEEKTFSHADNLFKNFYGNLHKIQQINDQEEQAEEEEEKHTNKNVLRNYNIDVRYTNTHKVQVKVYCNDLSGKASLHLRNTSNRYYRNFMGLKTNYNITITNQKLIQR